MFSAIFKNNTGWKKITIYNIIPPINLTDRYKSWMIKKA